MQGFIATAEAAIIDGGGKILHVNPVCDQHWGCHNLCQ
ncbi:Uncharacterised protein [Vibrio cholerae]|nr:Uncharacterised protein [Vibrio cholerae]